MGKKASAETINQGLIELGVSALLVPEEYGGLGLGLVEAALAQEALGAHVSPAQFTGNAMAIAGILSAANEEQKSEWLPKIASSEINFGVAVTEQVGSRDGAGVSASDGNLSGTALFALDADQASHLLVCDDTGSLHIVDAGTDGLNRSNLPTIDRTRRLTELKFDGAASVALAGKTNPVAPPTA